MEDVINIKIDYDRPNYLEFKKDNCVNFKTREKKVIFKNVIFLQFSDKKKLISFDVENIFKPK